MSEIGETKRRAEELAEKSSFGVGDLIEIMALLRSEGGCPWDREQTHESIRQNFIEETYEAAEAIDLGDTALLCEELGDVLLQVVFHARISEEEGMFTFADVADGICKKLVERHPHIFGSARADTSEEVLKNWDRIKQDSKRRTSVSEALEGVAKSLPALMRAGKLAKKAAKAEGAAPVIGAESPRALGEAEYGALLFSLAAEAALAGYEPERALGGYCEKFIEDFKLREESRESGEARG